MNKALWFVYDNLETKAAFHRLIFKSAVDAKLEAKITGLRLPAEQERLLKYFFKVQTASNGLLKNLFEGLQQEAIRILQNQKSLRWKQKEIEDLRKVLRLIIHNIRDYGMLTTGWEKRFESVASKIGNNHGASVSDYENRVKHFRDASASEIDKQEILIEEDWAKEWGKAHADNKVKPEAFSRGMILNKEEVLFYHFVGLFAQTLSLCEQFTKQFRREFRFSFENIIKNLPVEIVQEHVKFKDEALNQELVEILIPYVSRKSVKHLNEFFSGKTVERKIEFLEEKGRLLNLFWLLYQNGKVNSKPKQIGTLVANSFLLPRCPDGPELNAERVREAVSRKKAPSLYLSEVRKLAHRKKWIL